MKGKIGWTLKVKGLKLEKKNPKRNELKECIIEHYVKSYNLPHSLKLIDNGQQNN